MSEQDVMESPGKSLDSEVRTWAMVCHLAALAGIAVPIPFAGIIITVVVWQMKKDLHPFVDQNGRESLNFQIAVTAYAFVCFLLIFLLIGFVLLPALAIAAIILAIIAGLRAQEGQVYRYPLIFRVL